MRLNTDGLIIRETQTGEADRLVTVLTRDMGVIKAFVRGARSIKSRSLSATQLLSYSRFSVYMNREVYTIDEAEPIEVFYDVRRDVVRTALAMYFCELAGELAPRETDAQEVLSLTLNTLYKLSRNSLPTQQLKAIFELRLMSLSGYMPNLISCSVCGKYADEVMNFSYEQAQLYCRDCMPNIPTISLTIGVITAMRHICYSEPEKLFSFSLSPAGMKSLGEVTQTYLLSRTQHRFKSLDFYKSFT